MNKKTLKKALFPIGACLIIGLPILLKKDEAQPQKKAPLLAEKAKRPVQKVKQEKPQRKARLLRITANLPKHQRNIQILNEIAYMNPSSAVQTLVGLGEKVDFKTRMAALNKLTKRIDKNDSKALLEFMQTQYSPDLEMREIAFNAVKNDVLNLLLRQHERVDGVGGVLVDIANDDSYGEMWRDYAIQFMPSYYEQAFDREQAYENGEDNERDDMLNTLWEFAENRESQSSATALLALKDLAGNYQEIEAVRIVETAMDIVNDGTTPLGPRITALRLASNKELQTDEGAAEYFEENVRIIAQTGENIVLRMSAVKTLGEIGNADDVEFLEGMLGHKDKNMVKVAQAALDNLQN
ncbi:MAG: hypothetical protein HRT88_16455 [Lentisphaeraceae bacterium]|nr:hypothetical protein [Lentisphaeraceae bacterium]